MIYPGQYLPANPDIRSQAKFLEQLEINTSFGNVEAIYLKPQHPEISIKKAVIFAHGNNELIADCIDEMMPYTQLGYSVLIVEFPGYGRSAGKPSAVSIAETFRNAYDWLKQKSGTEELIVVGHGRSLGGAAVCQLAEERELSAMVLQSTFSDIRKFAQRYFLPGFLLRKALSDAVKRGVDVTVIIPKYSDVHMVDLVRGRYLGMLYKNGVNFRMFLPHNLHAKLMLIDGKTYSIGSANFDYRSFRYQLEIILIGRDDEVAAQINEHIQNCLVNSEPFNYDEWLKRPFIQRFFEWLYLPFRHLL